MLTVVVFGLVSLAWLAAGVALIAAPQRWNESLRRILDDPFSRFLLLQSTALAGLLLMLGASDQHRSWFWIAVGGLVAATALVLLGISEGRRNRLVAWWSAQPLWLNRVAGFVTIVLATLLAIEALRMG